MKIALLLGAVLLLSLIPVSADVVFNEVDFEIYDFKYGLNDENQLDSFKVKVKNLGPDDFFEEEISVEVCILNDDGSNLYCSGTYTDRYIPSKYDKKWWEYLFFGSSFYIMSPGESYTIVKKDLAPSASEEYDENFQHISLEPGEYQVKYFIRDFDRFSEINEENNVGYSTIIVG